MAAIVDRVVPGGGGFFAGTCSGHPLNVQAALATISVLADGSGHEHMIRWPMRIPTAIGRSKQRAVMATLPAS